MMAVVHRLAEAINEKDLTALGAGVGFAPKFTSKE